MSDLKTLFDQSGLSKDQIEDLIKTLIENPMAAMAKVGELNLDPSFMQQAMGIVMSNPQAVADFAQELGLSPDLVAEAKTKLAGMMPGGGD